MLLFAFTATHWQRRGRRRQEHREGVIQSGRYTVTIVCKARCEQLKGTPNPCTWCRLRSFRSSTSNRWSSSNIWRFSSSLVCNRFRRSSASFTAASPASLRVVISSRAVSLRFSLSTTCNNGGLVYPIQGPEYFFYVSTAGSETLATIIMIYFVYFYFCRLTLYDGPQLLLGDQSVIAKRLSSPPSPSVRFLPSNSCRDWAQHSLTSRRLLSSDCVHTLTLSRFPQWKKIQKCLNPPQIENP